jgi:hypothetical protein
MKVLWFLLLLSLHPLHGALSLGSPTETTILQDNHIFVLTVVAVNPSPWKEETSRTEARILNVRFRLDKNIRGDLDLKEGATAAVDLKQVRLRGGIVWDNPEFWSYYDLISGQSWMIGAESTATDVQTLLQHPKLAEVVSSPATVEDVQFMVQNFELPVAEQADRLAEWLDQTKEARGPRIGEYTAALLANPAASANMKLEKMAEDRTLEKRLTEDGQYAFLVSLYQAERSKSAVSPDSTARVLTRETIEFLFASSHNPESKMQRDIIQNYLPWLITLPQAESILRETMNETERSQVIAQLQRLSSSSSLSSRDRETLASVRELLSNMSPQ